MPDGARPSQKCRALIFLSALIATTLVTLPSPALRTMPTLRPSVNSAEGEGILPVGPSLPGHAPASAPSMSEDGRYVAFVSRAFNMDPDALDLNGADDVFVRDVLTATTTLVSQSRATGLQVTALGQRTVVFSGAGASEAPSVSSSGRYIAFESDARDLIVGDVNLATDIFVRDRESGTTVLLSKTSGGVQGNDASVRPSISGDGRWVAFQSRATNLAGTAQNGTPHVFLHDRDADDDGVFDQAGAISTILVSRRCCGTDHAANGFSGAPQVSASGSHVVFESDATDFASDRPGARDVFLFERASGTVTLISVNAGGPGTSVGAARKASVSADGAEVAFESTSGLLPQSSPQGTEIYVWDEGALTLPFPGLSDQIFSPALDKRGGGRPRGRVSGPPRSAGLRR